MNSKILKYLSFILIIIISGGILLSTFVFIRFNSIVQNFENGILIYSFFTLYICAVMLPILFRKKLKINGKTVIFKYPLSCIFVKVMYNGETEEEYHEIEKSFR